MWTIFNDYITINFKCLVSTLVLTLSFISCTEERKVEQEDVESTEQVNEKGVLLVCLTLLDKSFSKKKVF